MGCWSHPQSHSHSLGLSNRPWEQGRIFPPQRLQALLWVFQRRAGTCPKGKEQLSLLLSVFPKANHLGNPHLSRAPWQPVHREIKLQEKDPDKDLVKPSTTSLSKFSRKRSTPGPAGQLFVSKMHTPGAHSPFCRVCVFMPSR